jgi:hypothetical protein
MTTTFIPGGLVPVADTVSFADAERLALVGFLAGSWGLTGQAYTMDSRLFSAWCTSHGGLFAVRRVDIECHTRELEALGRARAIVARRMYMFTGFYPYAEQEGLIERSPAVHVRRPRLDYESHATALDHNELSARLVAAGLAGPIEHALVRLVALNGLRISEALGANVADLGLERGHRTITVVRKVARSSRCPSVHASPAPSTSLSATASTDPSSSPRQDSAVEPRAWPTAERRAGLVEVADLVVRLSRFTLSRFPAFNSSGAGGGGRSRPPLQRSQLPVQALALGRVGSHP